MTRIIAGTARGRRLAVPASGTRPTSDRVREAVFSIIESRWLAEGTSWPHVTVLDLFAGTGAFGLEALSRGAAAAVLVEKSRVAARALSANVGAVGCAGAQVLVRDARQIAALPPVDGGVSLCFVDPPYDWSASAIALLLTELGAAGWLAPASLVIVERPTKDAASPLPAGIEGPRQRAYGDTSLWYGHHTEAGRSGPGSPDGRHQ